MLAKLERRHGIPNHVSTAKLDCEKFDRFYNILVFKVKDTLTGLLDAIFP